MFPNILTSRKFIAEGFWVAVGQFVSIVGAFIGIRLLTEQLTPSEYGYVALGLTVATIANQTVLGPLGNGITRFYVPARDTSDLIGFFRQSVDLATIGTLLILLVGGAVALIVLSSGGSEWLLYIYAAFIFAILNGLNGILVGVQNAARQRKVVAFHQALGTWLRYGLAIALVATLGSSSTNVMLGFCLAIFIVAVSQWSILKAQLTGHYISQQSDHNWRSKIWQFSWPFTIFGSFTAVHMSSDRWALEHFSTTNEVGIYAAYYQIGFMPMMMASNLITQLVAPIFYDHIGDLSNEYRTERVKKYNQYLIWLVLGASFVAFGAAWFGAEWIVSVLLAKSYGEDALLLPWMVLAGGIFAAGQAVTLTFLNRMDSRSLIGVKIGTAIIGMTLNVAGAWAFGVHGVVFANVVFAVIFFLWLCLLPNNRQSFPLVTK